MSTLTGKKLDEVYHSLLKIDGNSDLSSTLQYIVDAQGNSSGIQVSTAGDMVATGDVTAAGFTGDLTGNADTATRWLNARTITIGDTGKSVDGTANVTWSKAEIGYDLQDVTDNGATTTNGITVANMLISATAPLLDFVDTNSFTDPNDRFRIRAAGDVGQVRWWDDSAGTDTVLATFSPYGDYSILGNITASGGVLNLYQNKIDGSTDNLKISADYNNVSGSSTIEFLVDGSEKMRIDNNGNVGIGISPSYKLDVNGDVFVNGDIFGMEVIGNTFGPTEYITFYGSKLAFGTGGSDKVTINSSGDVGIGTTLPSYKLHINGDAKVETSLTVGDSGQTNTYLYLLSSTTGESELRMGDTDTDAGSISYNNNSDLMTFRTGAADRVYIDSGGNVGINANSISAKLQIDSNHSQLRLRDTDDGTYTHFSSSNNLLAIRQNSTTASHFWMNSSGNVGLNQSSPVHKLQVDGSMGVRDGSFYIGNVSGTLSNDSIQIYKASGTNVLRMYNNAGGFGGSTTSGSAILELYSGSSYATRINGNGNSYFNAGNVGIGTTSPSEKLTVAGDITNDGDSRGIYWTGGTTSAQNRIVIGEQNNYGVGFRWDSGSSLQFDGFWATNVKGAANRTLGSIDVNNRIWYLYDSLVTNTLTVSNGVINMNNNDGFVYDDATNIMYVRADGSNNAIITANGGTFTGAVTLAGGLAMNNTNITGVNHIVINDSGVNEGIEWGGGNGWKIYESPDTLTNAAGNLQFVTGSTRRATIDTSGNLDVTGYATIGGSYAITQDKIRNIDEDNYFRINDDTTREELVEQWGGLSGGSISNITKVDDNTAPAVGCFELTGPIYADARGDYIKVDQNSDYTWEMWVKYVSGSDTDSRIYLGWQMYNSGKSSFGNVQRYWGQLGTQFDANSNNDGWYKITGTISGVGSSTSQFINGTEYVKPVLLLNYNGGSNKIRVCGFKLYRSQKRATEIIFSRKSWMTSSSESTENSTPRAGYARLANDGSDDLVINDNKIFREFGSVTGTAYNNTLEILMPQYAGGIRFKRTSGVGTAACSFINESNSTVGSITISNTSTQYLTTSDYRAKENIVTISDGIDRLKLLKPSRFNFIGNTEVVDGFIAHEAQEVVPQAVTGEKDAVGFDGEPIYQGIDQSKLVPLLTAALQEAVAKIEALEQRITILENN